MKSLVFGTSIFCDRPRGPSRVRTVYETVEGQQQIFARKLLSLSIYRSVVRRGRGFNPTTATDFGMKLRIL